MKYHLILNLITSRNISFNGPPAKAVQFPAADERVVYGEGEHLQSPGLHMKFPMMGKFWRRGKIAGY